MSEKRTKLESVATEAVQRKGLHNLSFRTLADEVGVKSASVHYYFPGKSDLASKLIENYSDSFAELLKQIDSRKRGLKGKLEGFVQIFEDAVKDDKLCLCGMMAAEVSTLDDESRLLLKHYFELAEDWIANILSENNEQISVNIQPLKLAKIIMSGLQGAILLDRVDGSLDRIKAQRDLIRSFVS